MGAWDIGIFDNDDAGDWVWTLEKASGTAVLEEAFSVIINAEGDLEASDCSVALAAAEVVAAMRGKGRAELPPDATKFAERFQNEVTVGLSEKAKQSVRKIASASELQELWDESANGEEWHNLLSDLSDRLS